eukprot:1151864-Pelagomonas_calceolata.AAC.2
MDRLARVSGHGGSQGTVYMLENKQWSQGTVYMLEKKGMRAGSRAPWWLTHKKQPDGYFLRRKPLHSTKVAYSQKHVGGSTNQRTPCRGHIKSGMQVTLSGGRMHGAPIFGRSLLGQSLSALRARRDMWRLWDKYDLGLLNHI